MRTRFTTAAVISVLLALTACGAKPEPDKQASDKPTPPGGSAAEAVTPEQQASARKAAGVPEEPTGAKRAELLATIGKVAPDAAEHEEKAVLAALNQCAAIHAKAPKLDWLASQRFSYKGVNTSETQGKKLNQALKDGFCKV
ncbi:hypothetical protein ACFYT4_23470 [Streptomyces sp. NPDC004609]|uniref:hypothetical protein n=1 Tax=Streptomyces sp. NPDC004609 TaxID=3364704 RepID=UPI00368A3BCB